MRSIIAITLILTALNLQAQVVPNATNADNLGGNLATNYVTISGADDKYLPKASTGPIIDQNIAEITQLKIDTSTERTARITTDDLIADATEQNKVEIDDNKTVIEELSASTLVLYFTDEVTSSGEYLLVTDTIPSGAESTVISSMDSATVVVTTFTVETVLGLSALRAGLYHSHFHAEMNNTNRDVRIRFEVYNGTDAAETFLFSSEQSDLITADKAIYDIHVSTNEIITTVNYLVVRIVADITGAAAAPILMFYMEGDNSSAFEMPALLSDVGVTKIIAGTNMTVTPTDGRGDVTVGVKDRPILASLELTDGATIAGNINMSGNIDMSGNSLEAFRVKSPKFEDATGGNRLDCATDTELLAPGSNDFVIGIDADSEKYTGLGAHVSSRTETTDTYPEGFTVYFDTLYPAVIHFPDGTVQTSSPSAGVAGGGNKNQAAITHKASAFWTDGYSNNAAITKKQFEVGGSTRSALYGKLTNTGDNYIITDGVMSREWNDADFTAYITFVTSGPCAGEDNVIFNVRFSTAQFDANSFTIIGTTTSAGATAWENGVRVASCTVTGTGLGDGLDYILEIRRVIADACTLDIFIKSASLPIAAD